MTEIAQSFAITGHVVIDITSTCLLWVQWGRCCHRVAGIGHAYSHLKWGEHFILLLAESELLCQDVFPYVFLLRYNSEFIWTLLLRNKEKKTSYIKLTEKKKQKNFHPILSNMVSNFPFSAPSIHQLPFALCQLKKLKIIISCESHFRVLNAISCSGFWQWTVTLKKIGFPVFGSSALYDLFRHWLIKMSGSPHSMSSAFFLLMHGCSLSSRAE